MKKLTLNRANFQSLDTLLQRRGFILEAYILENEYGFMANVLPGINFIRVDSLNAVLQTGSDFRFGSNGVGGVTTEGNISRYKVNKNLKN